MKQELNDHITRLSKSRETHMLHLYFLPFLPFFLCIRFYQRVSDVFLSDGTSSEEGHGSEHQNLENDQVLPR